jgi:hypothetical protein
LLQGGLQVFGGLLDDVIVGDQKVGENRLHRATDVTKKT